MECLQLVRPRKNLKLSKSHFLKHSQIWNPLCLQGTNVVVCAKQDPLKFSLLPQYQVNTLSLDIVVLTLETHHLEGFVPAHDAISLIWPTIQFHVKLITTGLKSFFPRPSILFFIYFLELYSIIFKLFRKIVFQLKKNSIQF